MQTSAKTNVYEVHFLEQVFVKCYCCCYCCCFALLLCCCVVFDCLVCVAQEQEILCDYTWHCFKPSTEQELNACVCVCRLSVCAVAAVSVCDVLVVVLQSFAFQFSAYQTIRQKVLHKIKDLCTYFA